MAVSLVIKNADFSENSLGKVHFQKSIMSSIPENNFKVFKEIAGIWSNSSLASNEKRCVLDFTNLAEFIGHFTKVKVILKDGFNMVFGSGSLENGSWYKGNCITSDYAWVDSNMAIAPISNSSSYIKIQFKKNDNSNFTTTTSIDDIVEDIILINQ